MDASISTLPCRRFADILADAAHGWLGASARCDCGKSLLVLDTASADAERLYVKLGWHRCGVIPGYALLPNGGLCDTTYFYRTLET